ncbi:hypothetical protein Nocox_05465 [Nonomuraea coxensis DSM 45129]|uniref:PPE family domain-containing protein n=1 Tax=Nonomuraea coxensis DSM 45129 TaxID=1122611 RepID=A0ABX8TTD1_9ACTN|nr:hypothetical protein [Nonomuraea coxensis]QYC38720.1 hypothetical protein Nocox_05465 [Nonomuraea coxensis DSM 45129]
MSEREVVVILSFDRMPRGEKPPEGATGDQIKQWLANTDPGSVTGAGQTYMAASTKVDAAIGTLEEHVAKIAATWKGPDAAKARHALEMLHASGRELSTKLGLMGGALQNYAERLTETKGKVNEPVLTGQVSKTALEVEKAETDQARKALYELNKEIVNLYNVQVPHDVSYELPTVSLSSPVNPKNVTYPGGSETAIPSAGSNPSGSGPSSFAPGSTNDPSSTNPGGTDPNGSNPNGSNPNGSDPNGSNPGGSDPNGSNPGGTDPNGTNPGGTDPNGSNPGTNPGDGTVPPVIGGSDRTTTDGPAGTDPARTDAASFTPQGTPTLTPTASTFTPSPFTPSPFGTTTPVTSISPPPSIGYTPGGATPGGIPSVIGSPGIIGGQSPAAAAGARGLGGLNSGMPFMPMMGGGVGGAGEGSGLERTTYLAEDPNSWVTGHDTTDPVIG